MPGKMPETAGETSTLAGKKIVASFQVTAHYY
jgi:hypothetical protein